MKELCVLLYFLCSCVGCKIFEEWIAEAKKGTMLSDQREAVERFIEDVGGALTSGRLAPGEISWLKDLHAGLATTQPDAANSRCEMLNDILYALIIERNQIDLLQTKAEKFGCLPTGLINLPIAYLLMLSASFASDLRCYFENEVEDPLLSFETPPCTPSVTPSPPSPAATPLKHPRSQRNQDNFISRLPHTIQTILQQALRPEDRLPVLPFLLVATLRSGSPDRTAAQDCSLYLEDRTGTIPCELTHPYTSYRDNTLLISCFNFLPCEKGIQNSRLI